MVKHIIVTTIQKSQKSSNDTIRPGVRLENPLVSPLVSSKLSLSSGNSDPNRTIKGSCKINQIPAVINKREVKSVKHINAAAIKLSTRIKHAYAARAIEPCR